VCASAQDRGEEALVAELIVVEPVLADPPEVVLPAGAEWSFVEPLVARICAEYGALPDEVRAHAVLLLRGYDNARVRSFVPILVEKKLRETYRRR
jgi:hypothetical protein